MASRSGRDVVEPDVALMPQRRLVRVDEGRGLGRPHRQVAIGSDQVHGRGRAGHGHTERIAGLQVDEIGVDVTRRPGDVNAEIHLVLAVGHAGVARGRVEGVERQGAAAGDHGEVLVVGRRRYLEIAVEAVEVVVGRDEITGGGPQGDEGVDRNVHVGGVDVDHDRVAGADRTQREEVEVGQVGGVAHHSGEARGHARREGGLVGQRDGSVVFHRRAGDVGGGCTDQRSVHPGPVLIPEAGAETAHELAPCHHLVGAGRAPLLLLVVVELTGNGSGRPRRRAARPFGEGAPQHDLGGIAVGDDREVGVGAQRGQLRRRDRALVRGDLVVGADGLVGRSAFGRFLGAGGGRRHQSEEDAQQRRHEQSGVLDHQGSLTSCDPPPGGPGRCRQVSTVAHLPKAASEEAVQGADGGTRTPMSFRTPGPKPGAYTSSATSAACSG